MLSVQQNLERCKRKECYSHSLIKQIYFKLGQKKTPNGSKRQVFLSFYTEFAVISDTTNRLIGHKVNRVANTSKLQNYYFIYKGIESKQKYLHINN